MKWKVNVKGSKTPSSVGQPGTGNLVLSKPGSHVWGAGLYLLIPAKRTSISKPRPTTHHDHNSLLLPFLLQLLCLRHLIIICYPISHSLAPYLFPLKTRQLKSKYRTTTTVDRSLRGLTRLFVSHRLHISG